MPAVNEVWDFINAFAPAELAEEWDNVGPLVVAEAPADKMLVALDITPDVVEEAAQKGCGLVVSHHPVIFKPLASLHHQSVVYQLARRGISAVCAHTNLDAAVDGVNDVLAALLGLLEVESFGGLGRIGRLEAPMGPADVARLCGGRLQADVHLADAGRPVRRLAVVGGSGGDFWRAAAGAGADMLLTGEAGHHDGLDALAAGFSLAVAGHYATEWPVVSALAQKLAERFVDAQVLVSEKNRAPFSLLGRK